MKIIFLADSDSTGGSGRSAYRIHSGLSGLGVDTRMLVKRKFSGDPKVRTINGGQLSLRLADKAAALATYRLGLQHWSVPSTRNLLRDDWFAGADAVQVFNVWGGVFSIRSLPEMSRRKPIVWRLSDQWLFTGHCCYSYDCDRWKSGCGQCPQLDGDEQIAFDTTALLWKTKKKIFSQTNLTVAAPSRWIESLAKESPLLAGKQIVYIPNGVNRDYFYPRARASAREALGIDPNATVLLFGAASVTSKRKGGAELTEALQRLGARENLHLLVFGSKGENFLPDNRMPVHYTGYINNDHLLATVYSAADIYALPTLADNLPNSILEAMACGCPVVSFDVGGVSDAVHHRESGYLAKLGDAQDLANGLRLLVDGEETRRRMSEKSLEIIRQRFTIENEASSFKQLYESLIEETKTHE